VVSTPYRKFNPDERPTLFYIPLTGLLTMAAIAILLGQSINRSIAQLERATRRIVQGDLDFELSVRGNDKFAALTRSFDSMREHLKEEYARRARFMMGVSHDLKTPLSSIAGYTSAIRDGFADTPEKLRKYTAIIESKTGLLESRISMLIDFVKQDSKEWETSLQEIDIGQFLREFASVYEAELAMRRFVFVPEIDIDDGLRVAMDADMVTRALENLAHNAVEYSPEGGRIDFTVRQHADEIEIAIANEGPGIAKEDLPYIFDPFVRGARDRKGRGFGLGLAAVQSVISSHGWTISVVSEPDVQTAFTISIPMGKT
jgi:signal transduction histidine kinase